MSATRVIFDIIGAAAELGERIPGIPGIVFGIIDSIIDSAPDRLAALRELRAQVEQMADEDREPTNEEWLLLKQRKRDAFERLSERLAARASERS